MATILLGRLAAFGRKRGPHGSICSDVSLVIGFFVLGAFSFPALAVSDHRLYPVSTRTGRFQVGRKRVTLFRLCRDAEGLSA